MISETHETAAELLRAKIAQMSASGEEGSLESLLLRVQAQRFLDEYDEERARERMRKTLPPGYELTRSGGKYGFRRIGGRTKDWVRNAGTARRCAWDDLEAVAEEEAGEITDTSELALHTSADAQLHRVLIDLSLRAFRYEANHPGRIFDLEDLFRGGLAIHGGEEALEAVVDRLVLLGVLEELPEDLKTRGPVRAFRWNWSNTMPAKDETDGEGDEI